MTKDEKIEIVCGSPAPVEKAKEDHPRTGLHESLKITDPPLVPISIFSITDPSFCQRQKFTPLGYFQNSDKGKTFLQRLLAKHDTRRGEGIAFLPPTLDIINGLTTVKG